MALEDYGGLIASARNASPDYATQEAQKQLLALRKGELQQQMQQAQQQIEQENGFRSDMATVLANPTAAGYAAVIARNPKFAQQAKQSWDMMDEGRQKADLQSGAEMYSAAANGRFDLAATLLKRRLEADKAAGQPDDPTDAAILAALESDDPVQQKAAMGMIGLSLSAVTGPDKFAATLGQLTKGNDPEIRSVEMGGSVAERDPTTGEWKETYRNPYFKDADGNIGMWEGGGQASGQGGSGSPTGPTRTDLPAPQAAVASVLSASLPAHVVSGFLGNFDAEGGYGGAKGDGGSAHGLAQWRGERQSNFQRIIGKPIGDATHAEQAKFVLWEMQNPEQAGMTIAQRDKIMLARSPQEAAVLIDKHYERSSGQHRDRRVAAAVRYAGVGGAAQGGPGYKIISQKTKDAPSGYRYSADGNLVAIPGGPADKPAEGKEAPSGYRWAADGTSLEAIPGGPGMKGRAGLPKVPAATVSAYIGNNKSVRSINETLAGIAKHPDALGGWNQITPDFVAQRIDPKGVNVRAGVSDVGSLIIHDRSGAAVTISETPRLLPFVPQKSDTPETAKKKLLRLRQELVSMNQDMADAYSNEEGDSQLLRIGRSRAASAGGAVRVRSVQEAKKLPAGTLFVTPDGRTMRKR